MSGSISRLHTYKDGEDEIVGQDHIDDYDQIINAVNTHFATTPIDHAAGSVGSDALATGSATTAKLAADAVTSAKIADSQILREHIYEGVNYATMAETEIVTGSLDADPTNIDGSVLYDSGVFGSSHVDMTLVFTAGTASGNRYSIAASTATGYCTLDLAAAGGGNAYSAGARSGDAYRIVKTPIRAGHIGLNEIHTEHILDGEITIPKCASGVSGYHGNKTRIKILPSDFVPNNSSGVLNFNNSDGGSIVSGTYEVGATVVIPTGYKATAVMIYGSDVNNAVEVYACDINNNTATLKSPASQVVGTEIDITDVTADATNYLAIMVAQGSGDEIYGGYVTIEAA